MTNRYQLNEDVRCLHKETYRMDIACTFSRDHYVIGETAVLLLKGISSSIFDNAIILGQIHGHVHADTRWIKIDNRLKDFNKSSTSTGHDYLTTIPCDPSGLHDTSSFCCFATSRVTLSPSHLFESGVFLEFAIPYGCFPSFKGLSGGVSYYLTITIQSPTEMKFLHYPLIFNGNSVETQYHTRFSSLVSYPVSSLPPESYFIYPQDMMDVEDNYSEYHAHSHHKPSIYKVRDRDYLCSLHLYRDVVESGQDILLQVDFRDAIQECVAMKASLILCEKRVDYTRIQDKVVSTILKCTEDADKLNVSLNMPTDSVCSFECPLFNVSYRIDLEFCLERNIDNDNQVALFDNAFSFDIPITVTPHSNGQNKNNSENDSNKANTLLTLQLAHMCLESNVQSYPLVTPGTK